jgi:hypothetical protein
LRALKYWGSPEEAETMTNNLYVEKHSWKRAAFQASEMFTKLALGWKFYATPLDPFQEVDPHNIFSTTQSRILLSGSKAASKTTLAEVENVVTKDFVVSALKSELV